MVKGRQLLFEGEAVDGGDVYLLSITDGGRANQSAVPGFRLLGPLTVTNWPSVLSHPPIKGDQGRWDGGDFGF